MKLGSESLWAAEAYGSAAVSATTGWPHCAPRSAWSFAERREQLRHVAEPAA
ncbi:MAG TPA: hypothetical protein VEY49_02490 [Solirubrobacteraceae bacterium]|nr:hypothetical protein [Solirubrobacteraceae bacterium]